MYLVISEKPSVAQTIAKVLGAYQTEDGYLSGRDCIVSWCLGHLAEYAMPEAYDAAYGKWRFDDLPLIPGEWKLEVAQEKKEQIRDLLRARGIDLEQMKADQNMTEVDDFDFICHVAFDKKPLTRRERANNVKKRDFLSKYSGTAREVLEALLDKYMNTGIYEIEKTEVLKLDPFLKMGKPAKIASYFGGREGYRKAVKELENEIYMDEVI